MTEHNSRSPANGGGLRIMIVDVDAARAAAVTLALESQGHKVVAHQTSCAGLLRALELSRASLVLIDLQTPDRDTLESCALINEHHPLPIVLFSPHHDSEFIRSAVSAGVTAYQLDSITPDRARAVLEIAVAQFDAHQQLKATLTATQRKLAQSSAVEQAKGLLMARHSVDEPAAHRLLQQLAMEQQQKLEDTARHVIRVLGRQRKENGNAG
ncbi:MAG: ANTAR domain-containing protein [Gammaproteobacteria bacterium]|nr:ANTAR domain-containing protein [Gammaproteobacteria bacterium]